MDLSEKAKQVCKEISYKTDYQLKSIMIDDLGLSPAEYYGFQPRRRFQIFYKNPIFKLHEEDGKVILTSFFRENDDLIKNIAEANEFDYAFEVHSSCVNYL
jgi:hypothetical protein